MAVAVLFTPDSMTVQRYDEAIKRLEAAGAGQPAGRVFHVCFGQANKLRVFDLWESEGAFETFGQTLVPILDELGLNTSQPEVVEVHNILRR